MNRRTFLHNTSAASLGYLSFPHIRKQTTSYKVVLIGSGWWGTNILREAVASKTVEVVGICDVDQRQLEACSKEVESWTGKKPRWYTNYQACISQANPDIAIVATPDHWHALCAIEAINAGAHVYVEKPISHTILEGRAILSAARTNERVVQVGTHRRVSPHNISAMEFLRSGKVGDISAVKCFVNYGQGPGEATEDEDAPEGLDWNAWVGPAPYQNYNPKIHPRGFRQFLDFANGTIGDWGIHWFDQVLWWTEERFPTNIYSTGGRLVKQDNSDAPDTQLAVYDFETFKLYWEHKLTAPNANESHNVGCYFYGTEGTLHLGWRDGWTFYPKRKSESKVEVPPQLHDPDQQNIKELWADLIHSIENKTRPVCDIENGYLATNMSLLAMISMQLGRNLHWDGHAILDDKEAQGMMKRDYRAPYIYPS